MLASAQGPSCHHDHGWFDAWFAAFAPDQSRIDPIVACVSRRERLGPFRISICASATNVHSIAFDAIGGVPADLPGRLFAATGADVIRFDYLAEEAALLAAAPGWRSRYRVTIAPHAIAPLADCRQNASAWFAARSKRLRQRLRGDIAACDRLEIETIFCDEAADLPALLDEMFALEAAGWKGRAGSAIRDDPAAEAFYRDLVARAQASGALRLALMRREGVLVAFEIGVLHARRLSVLKVAYDEAYADQSAGFVLAARHIGYCCADPGIDWYDKMGNGMTPAAYKLRFADTLATYRRVTVYRATWRGWLFWGRDRARALLKAWRDRRRARAA